MVQQGKGLPGAGIVPNRLVPREEWEQQGVLKGILALLPECRASRHSCAAVRIGPQRTVYMQPNGCIITGMDQDAVFKALADQGRRTLLDQLHKTRGLTLRELCESLAMTRQAVSKHLRILENAGLIGTRNGAGGKNCII